MEYQYLLTPPKYFQGQKCEFMPHNKKEYIDYGEIVGVETHYGKQHNGYHIYSIAREGKKRLVHIGEHRILSCA